MVFGEYATDDLDAVSLVGGAVEFGRLFDRLRLAKVMQKLRDEFGKRVHLCNRHLHRTTESNRWGGPFKSIRSGYN